MITTDFKSDFNFFVDKIQNCENFTLSRWGDGELMILEGTNIDIRSKGNGEFRYKNGDELSERSRNILKDSYTYNDDEYYIGIACRCCVGDDKFEYMKTLSRQTDSKLTWANIFVNSNYRYVKTYLIPSFTSRTVNIVFNEKSSLNNVPFDVNKTWKVGTDAWINNLSVVDDIKNYISSNNVKDEVFLFSAGPLSNILTHQLHIFNKNNTYIDIGSIFDGYFGLKLTRGYLTGASTLNKTCIW